MKYKIKRNNKNIVSVKYINIPNEENIEKYINHIKNELYITIMKGEDFSKMLTSYYSLMALSELIKDIGSLGLSLKELDDPFER